MSIRYFGEEGDVERSWVCRRSPSLVDQLFGFEGFVDAALLRAADPALQVQLETLSSFDNLQEVTFQSVESDLALSDGLNLPAVRRASFYHCDSGFVETLLDRLPLVESLEFYECPNLGDKELLATSRLGRLVSMTVDGSEASGKFLASHSGKTNIRSLTIRYSPLSLEGIELISRLDGLSRLVLEFPTSGVDRQTVEKHLQGMSGLPEMVLAGFEGEK